jgi:hypothetical protein
MLRIADRSVERQPSGSLHAIDVRSFQYEDGDCRMLADPLRANMVSALVPTRRLPATAFAEAAKGGLAG